MPAIHLFGLGSAYWYYNLWWGLPFSPRFCCCYFNGADLESEVNKPTRNGAYMSFIINKIFFLSFSVLYIVNTENCPTLDMFSRS